MASFATKRINYYEDRTDGNYAWNVRYDLSFQNGKVQTTLDVKLVGANPGATKDVWEKGTEAIWNNRAFFSDGTRLYEVKLDLRFVTSGEDQVVNVVAGSGRTNMSTWYLNDPWGPSMYDEVAAHEVGHMLGNYDEYSGGATHNGYVTSGTLMSDLTQAGFADYYWTIEYFTEQFSGQTMSTVLAKRGTAAANTLNGGTGMDGIYGFGGDDKIEGGNGNDYLDGGANNDTVRGGYGNDQVFGGSGNDVVDGHWGFDTIDGGIGSDTVEYKFFNYQADVNLATGRVNFTAAYSQGGQFDTLVSIEHVVTGNAGDKITGNAVANRLNGAGGNDTINGGLGNDTLVGAAGADRFLFDSTLGSGNIDTVESFVRGTDRIYLDDKIFKNIGGALSSAQFWAAAGATKAHDPTDRIVYDMTSRKVYFDIDGDLVGGKAAIAFAVLTGNATYNHLDFAIV